jgi:hypothetical protein
MSDSRIFFTILGIGVLCSAIPLGYLGMIFGFPSVLLNSIFLTFLHNKSKKNRE